MSKENSTEPTQTFGQFGKAFQEKTVQALLTDTSWAEQMLEVFKSDYFELKYLQFIAKTYFEYAQKYKTFPTMQLLLTIVRDELKTGSDKLLAEQIAEYLVRMRANPDVGDLQYIKEKSLDFCRKQALKEAILKSVDLMENEKYESIVGVIKEAVTVGTTPSMGHDFFADHEMRFQPQVRNAIPTGIPELDAREILDGGLGAGEIGVIVGGTGTGKCTNKESTIQIQYQTYIINDRKFKPWDKVLTKRGELYVKDLIETDELIFEKEHNNKLICQICGFESVNLATHMFTHNITSEQYKERFKDCKLFLCTEEQKRKFTETKIKHISQKRLDCIEKQKANIQSAIDANMPILQCRFCNFTSRLSLIGHINKKHHIQISDYRLKYPDDILQQNTPLHNEKSSFALKENMKDVEYKKNFLENWRCPFKSETKYWTRKGYSEDDAKLKVSEWQTIQAKKASNSEFAKQRKIEVSTGDNNPMSLRSIAKKYNVSIEEARKLTPCYGRIGDKHPMFGQHHTQESLEKIANSPHLKNPDYRSIPEQEVVDFCKEINSNFECNVKISKWNVDICYHELKLVIEFFGDFWHHNPNKYKPDWINPVTKTLTQDMWDRDKQKIEYLKSLGYNVVVVWEFDWKYNQENCKESLLKCLK